MGTDRQRKGGSGGENGCEWGEYSDEERNEIREREKPTGVGIEDLMKNGTSGSENGGKGK